MKPNRLGNYIKQLRKNKGISQKVMSANLGLKQSTYSNYENGYNEPPTEVLDKLSEILKVDLFSKRNEFNQIVDIQDEKKAFLNGYENETEQLLFFEELLNFRHFVDQISDKRNRRELADLFSQLLDEFGSIVTANESGDFRKKEILEEGKIRLNRIIEELIQSLIKNELEITF